MTPNPEPTIVVGVDGSHGSAHALRWAILWASEHGGGIRAVTGWEHPMSGWANPVGVSRPPDDEVRHAHEAALSRHLDAVCRGCNVPITKVVAQGPTAKVLLDEAAGADLLVLGTRGRGRVAGVLVGSVGRQVAAAAPCPVVLVPEFSPLDHDGSLVVGVDGSATSRAALGWAGRFTDGPIRVVHALEHPFDPRYADAEFEWEDPLELGEQLVEAFVAEVLGDREGVTTSVVRGDPRQALVDAASEGSMIVVGARGATGLDALILGSVTAGVASRATVPVVIFPGR